MIRLCLLVLTLGACDGFLDLGDDGTAFPKPPPASPFDGNNLNCADDSTLEPNDIISQAFQTAVATQKNNLSLAGLAICPSGDKDNYSVTITTQNQSLEVLIEYDPAGGELQGSILNSGGAPLANASPTTPGHRRAYTPFLPTGVYYAAVMGSMTTNNYRLTINVTGP